MKNDKEFNKKLLPYSSIAGVVCAISSHAQTQFAYYAINDSIGVNCDHHMDLQPGERPLQKICSATFASPSSKK